MRAAPEIPRATFHDAVIAGRLELHHQGPGQNCKEGTDSIGSTLKKLEPTGYIVRNRLRDSKSKIEHVEYVIYETPSPPDTCQPCVDKPDTVDPFGIISIQVEYTKMANSDRSNRLLIYPLTIPMITQQIVLFNLELSSQVQQCIEEYFKRRFPAEAFAWTTVQFGNEGCYLSLIKVFHINRLGTVQKSLTKNG